MNLRPILLALALSASAATATATTGRAPSPDSASGPRSAASPAASVASVADYTVFVDPPTGFVFVKLPAGWKFVGRLSDVDASRLPANVITTVVKPSGAQVASRSLSTRVQ